MKFSLFLTALCFSLIGRASQNDNFDFKHEYNEGTATQSFFKIDENKEYKSVFKMRDQRKVGVGAVIGGSSGIFGLQAELNFEYDNSGFGAFGWGQGYNTATLGWRHYFNDGDLSYYSSLGYSKWYDVSGDNGNAKKSSILQSVLKKNEIGRPFTADFVSAGAGIQFSILNGEMAGAVFFAELNMLYEPFRSKLVPVGTVGSTFYF